MRKCYLIEENTKAIQIFDKYEGIVTPIICFCAQWYSRQSEVKAESCISIEMSARSVTSKHCRRKILPYVKCIVIHHKLSNVNWSNMMDDYFVCPWCHMFKNEWTNMRDEIKGALLSSQLWKFAGNWKKDIWRHMKHWLASQPFGEKKKKTISRCCYRVSWYCTSIPDSM